RAVAAHATELAGGALDGAGAATVGVRLRPVLGAVAAGRHLTEAGGADEALAVAGDPAGLPIGALGGAGAAAVGVRLRPVLGGVVAGRRQAHLGNAVGADRVEAVGSHGAQLPVGALAAGASAAVGVGLVAVLHRVVAERCLADT